MVMSGGISAIKIEFELTLNVPNMLLMDLLETKMTLQTFNNKGILSCWDKMI